MKNLIRNSGSICLVVAALSASDGALVIRGALHASRGASLSAQENRQSEEELFLDARRALNRGHYDNAALILQKLRRENPAGRFVTDSYYWEAFARYRQDDLPEAELLLDLVWAYNEVRYGGRLFEDVRDLRLRVRRQLAERGDPRAAEEVLRESEAALVTDTARLGTSVSSQRRARLNRVLADLRWRADSAMAVRSAMLRTDSLARDYAQRRARADSLTAIASREVAVADLVRAQTAAAGALSEVLVQADTSGVPMRPAELRAVLARTISGLGANASRLSFLGDPPDVPAGCQQVSLQQEALTALLRLQRDPMRSVHEVLGREDRCSAHLRHQAVSWLARQGTEEAESTLVEAATIHADAETRKWAVMALAEFRTPGAADVLSQVLGESGDEAIRSEAITALRYNPNEQATEALAAFMSRDGEPDNLREEAAAALGLRIGTESAALTAVFDKVDADGIRIRFLEMLGRRVQAGEAAVAAWLFERALDRDLSLNVRKAALEAWSRGSTIDLQRLAESYGEFEESDLRERVFYALYLQAESDEEHAPAVIDRMIELARAETDAEVRERAVYWLGRTGSERAAEFLMELLRDPPSGPSVSSGQTQLA